jgi:hypothetical protein
MIPSGLAERLFSVLFDDYDLLTVDGTTMAIPKDGSIPVFTGSTLSEITLQIASYRGTTTDGPFAADVKRGPCRS